MARFDDNNYDSYMHDCIHLRACRRLQKKYWMKGISRGCDESCTAYISGNTGSYVDVDEALEYARDGADSIRSGYDSYDVYAGCDLQGMTLGDIVESEQK